MIVPATTLKKNDTRALVSSLPLTDSLGKPVHPLSIRVGFIPDVSVGQIGWGVEPFLEEVALHCYHQVNL